MKMTSGYHKKELSVNVSSSILISETATMSLHAQFQLMIEIKEKHIIYVVNNVVLLLIACVA